MRVLHSHLRVALFVAVCLSVLAIPAPAVAARCAARTRRLATPWDASGAARIRSPSARVGIRSPRR